MAFPIRLLIAEDHPIVRDGIRRLLENERDIQIVGEAKDGAEARDKAGQLHPDVILMDLVMPQMNGIEATRAILAAQPNAGVLVFTGFGSDDQVFAAIKAGARGYLLKDCESREVVEAIRHVARGEPSLASIIAGKILAEFSHPPHDLSSAELLSPREVEALKLVAHGKSNREIAHELSITEMTVRSHMSNILGKLHLASRTQAVLYALREGIASLADAVVAEQE